MKTNSCSLEGLLTELGYRNPLKGRVEGAKRPLQAKLTKARSELWSDNGRLIVIGDATDENYQQFKKIAETANAEATEELVASLPPHLW